MRVMAFVLLGLASCSQAPDPPPAAPEPERFTQLSADPAEHGKRLAAVLGCSGCHNDDFAGQDWSDAMGTLWTANLTRSADKYSSAELAAMITQGRRSDRALLGMPSFLFSDVHPADIDALVTYLKTLEPKGEVHPEPSIGPVLKDLMAKGEVLDAPAEVAKLHDLGPPDLGPEFGFGRFIVRASCVECHGIDAAGNDEPMEDDGNPPPDLRIVGSYSREDFATLMGTGKAAGGREIGLMSKVARRRYANFSDAEERAVYAYLAELARRDVKR